MRRACLSIAGVLLVIGAVLLPLQAAEPAKESAAPLKVTYYYLPG